LPRPRPIFRIFFGDGSVAFVLVFLFTMRSTRILIWRRTRLFVHPIIPRNLTYSCGGRSSSTSGEVERTNLAFLLGILGGLLMLVLPVASVQVYNGPPCVSTSACPTVPESARGALLCSGVGRHIHWYGSYRYRVDVEDQRRKTIGKLRLDPNITRHYSHVKSDCFYLAFPNEHRGFRFRNPLFSWSPASTCEWLASSRKEAEPSLGARDEGYVPDSALSALIGSEFGAGKAHPVISSRKNGMPTSTVRLTVGRCETCWGFSSIGFGVLSRGWSVRVLAASSGRSCL
jgi:prepilin signal peptidase PulO-like enzyme (type II secretory pathway)